MTWSALRAGGLTGGPPARRGSAGRVASAPRRPAPSSRTRRSIMAVRTEASRDRIVIAGGGIAGLCAGAGAEAGAGRGLCGRARRSGAGAPSRAPTTAPMRSRPPRRRCCGRSGSGRRSPQTAQPMTEMVVSDSRSNDVVRPVFLTFDGEVEPGQPFAHMVENAALIDGAARRLPRGRRRASARGRAQFRGA